VSDTPPTLVPPSPPPVWVTTADLAGALGSSVLNDPDGAQLAVDVANGAVAHRIVVDPNNYDPTVLAANPLLITAALTCAVDWYRRPKTAAGIYQVGDFYARLPADFYASIDAAIAASGVMLAGGFG